MHATKVPLVCVTDDQKDVSQVDAFSTNEAAISTMNESKEAQPFNMFHHPFSEGITPTNRGRRGIIVSSAKIDHQEVVSRKRREKSSLCSLQGRRGRDRGVRSGYIIFRKVILASFLQKRNV